jgi:phage terminase large subunit
MEYKITTATKKIFQLNKRIRAVSGGTSASKTISILLWLINYAQMNHGEIISIVSESFPHLKRGAMRDFLNIMEAHHYFRDELWNKTDSIYTFETGSKIEFFSADQSDKVKGARRQVLFVNEANNIPYETFTQLEIRTSKIIWLDWNPTFEFWFYSEVLPHIDCDFITLTYLDNEAFSLEERKALETHRHNIGWWKIYGEGQLGVAEGRIYKDWEIIDDFPNPFDYRLERYGLDFGYTNDPTAMVAVYKHNDGFILDELLYQMGMSNREIANFVLNLQPALIMADSAEPKSIDEISSYIKPRGWNILGALKGTGSVLQGIQYVQDHKIQVTKRSVNLIKEYHNYLWMTDRNGKIINEPTPIYNHQMDAIRYAMSADFVKDRPPVYNPPDRDRILGVGMPTEWGGVEGY